MKDFFLNQINKLGIDTINSVCGIIIESYQENGNNKFISSFSENSFVNKFITGTWNLIVK